MKNNTHNPAHSLLKALIQKSIEHESSKVASCPHVWSYQPHRPDAPLLKTPLSIKSILKTAEYKFIILIFNF